MRAIPTPPYFVDDLDDKEVQVLQLVEDGAAKYNDGWCTYTYAIDGCPELEVICGGVNDKTPKAGAIWRQGNLLHFGFEPPPSALNRDGAALLVNSIAYISRFVDDRPIIYTPSPFKSKIRFFNRAVVHGALEAGDINRLKYYVTADTFTALNEMDLERAKTWAEQYVRYVKPGEGGKLEIDLNAFKFGISPASDKFLAEAIDNIKTPGPRSALAKEMLDRYVPTGPVVRSDPTAWEQWHDQNRDYLFFSDSGGYRWYIDPLAKERNVTTDSLRGRDRASLPRVK